MRKFTLLMALTACISLLQAQTSPDYIFGAAGANWTTGVQGTQVASGVYQWQFTAAATGDQYFKLGETAAITDGSGFWTNGDGTDLAYTGAGAMWDVYYKANMGDGGAVKFAATTGNYYIIQARKNSGDANAKFAVFESPSAIATIASVTQAFASPNLTVTVNASVAPAAVQKFWVRYTKDNWASSGITEAAVTGTAGTAVIDVTGMDKLEYYVFTTVQAPAGFTDYDFYTVSLNNNGGKNYAYYAPMTGNYYMPTIPEGQKGFSSLSAAVTAINAAGLAGDVNFLINGDITEAANIGLGVNTNGHKITIRPDADADRIITFTKLSDNTSPTGHFVIGYTDLTSAWSDANTIATSNVTIDGYAVGGTTRRLTVTNTNASHTGARMIVVVGACENTVIKNCIINNLTTSTSSPFCVGAVVRKGTAIEVAPKNLTIENNVLTALGNNVAMGVRITNSGTIAAARLTGLVFKNNIVTSKRRLFEINYTTGGEISGNTFETQQTGVPGTVSYGLWTATGVDGTINIFNNKFIKAFTEETGAYGHRVVSLASGATYNIYNNTFSGLDKTKASTAALNLAYLFYSGVAGKIYHNTFYMPQLTDPSQTGGYYRAIVLSGNTAEIKNNIFISDEVTHTNTSFISAVPTPATDYNLFYLRQPHTGATVVSTYATLTDYQTANPTKDANSKSKNVYFASATDLSIAGTSINDPDLSAPALAAVTTDIFGTARHTPLVYKGAHEASDLNLPAPTKTFTVTAPVGTEKVYVAGSFTGKNWDITNPYELTATVNPNEFSGTFACADGVEYKYFCEKGDWDYQEATSANPLTWANNHTWTASDNVLYWFAMPKVTLNASIGSGGIPANLFVKGSWNGWATAIELTKTGESFTGIIGGNVGDKIYANTAYKYFSNDPTADNWETGNDRLSIYPAMTDVIASFTTPIPLTGISKATEMSVRIMRTPMGITAVFDGNAVVELYSINGALIDKTNATGSYSRELNHGAYIIRINGKATKFVK